MRKSPYFAMSVLLTALGAHAADLTGTTPSPIGASTTTSGSTSTPYSNTGVNTQTGANASATSRDAPPDTNLPVAPPLQSTAPTESPSTTPGSTTATGNSGTANGKSTGTPRMRSNAGTTSTTSTTTGTAPDNTRINQRDRDNQTLTPGDQANTKEDISTTSSIRQALMKSDLSTIARNIKIMTNNGRVTLRGPVKTAAEKARIESLARTAAGATTVDNQLDVKATTY